MAKDHHQGTLPTAIPARPPLPEYPNPGCAYIIIPNSYGIIDDTPIVCRSLTHATETANDLEAEAHSRVNCPDHKPEPRRWHTDICECHTNLTDPQIIHLPLNNIYHRRDHNGKTTDTYDYTSLTDHQLTGLSN